MLDKEILIKTLEDFKDTKKYSSKQLAEFLAQTRETVDFYKQHIDKMNTYIQKYPRTIIKFLKDIKCFYPHSDGVHYEYRYEYSEEERKMIMDIIDRFLLTFRAIDIDRNNICILNLGKVKTALYIYARPHFENTIQDLIDYIIKFCPERGLTKTKENKSNTKIKLYYIEEDTIKVNNKEIKLSPFQSDCFKDLWLQEKRFTTKFYCKYSSQINKKVEFTGKKLIEYARKTKTYKLNEEDFILNKKF